MDSGSREDPTERAVGSREIEPGNALIIAGYETGAPRGEDRLPRITRLGEVLLGSAAPWRIRRLAAPGPERDAPTRRNVRREIDAWYARPAAARLLVIAGEITRTVEGLSLVCAPELGGFHEDATVALAWIGDRLRATSVATAVLLAACAEPRDAPRWLSALAPGGTDHLIVVHAADPVEALDALYDGLTRGGQDSETRAVTLRALTGHFERCLPAAAIHRSPSTAPVLVRATIDPDLVRLAGPPREPDPDELVGSVLPGQFRIEREIGRGGFAVVYHAHQELVGRDVAIKVLQRNIAADAAHMFLAEIKTVARLDHRNIVRVLHADVTRGGRMFLAMELLTGRTLHQLLDELGSLPPARAIAIAVQLLSGLAAAHASGVIHADVKPANVFVVEGEPDRIVLLDFGLSRLQASAAVTSLGGTPAFMAPEQLRNGVVDARSDLYATGLVLLAMLTGHHTGLPLAVAAAIDGLDDARLRTALRRSLAEDPAMRFASAAEMAEALRSDAAVEVPRRPPFRPAAPFSEDDRAEFFGRDREIALLLEHVLFRRTVIYVAPSGTGKTSLLRAGLAPRLAQLGVRTVYIACRSHVVEDLAMAIAPDAATVAGAVARHAASTRRLVIVLDQVEAALLVPADTATVIEALEISRWPVDAQVSIVLSVREEYLARLLDRTQQIEQGIPVVRLGPLSPEAARDALVRTLAARQLAIEDRLGDALIEDLVCAASKLAIELSWGAGPAIYAPHLQLAGAVLYEALPAGASELTLALYQRLGGLDKIVAEHLHHVLEGELSPGDTTIARDLLLALVGAGQVRAARRESELIAIARVPSRGQPSDGSPERPASAVLAVIGFLRDRGLLMSAAGPAGETLWDLAHDSLVQRVQEWITSTDLARLRALEQLRHHLRRIRAGNQSLLGAGELREVKAQLARTDLARLDAEWARPGEATPANDLIAASRRALRKQHARIAGWAIAAVAVAAVLALRLRDERLMRERETTLRDRDIGHFLLAFRVFDWDPATLTARDVPEGGSFAFDWELRKPDNDDDDSPGAPYPPGDLSARVVATASGLRNDEVAARGGPAVLVIHRRDPGQPAEFCHDVLLPIRRLPGYSSDPRRPRFEVRVPSCAATRAGMVAIPGGSFIAGGQGEPRTPYDDRQLSPEATVELPPYWIDRTEVPVGALGEFLAMQPLHGIARPPYPDDPERYPQRPEFPAAAITWREARAFCRYLGKDLPTIDEWDKALRGGLDLAGARNPCPRRNFAWCGDMRPGWANVRAGDRAQPRPVGAMPHDVSPYGVADMVGNVQEWTRSPALAYETLPATQPEPERHRLQTQRRPMVMTRGCNWGDLECAETPLAIMPLPSQRLRDVRYFTLGMRCVVSDRP
ncbi:MAG TPA: SUMF1/EgtB/PvdO family nonheme iron enzyme [Kofleriaceae bacterium]